MSKEGKPSFPVEVSRRGDRLAVGCGGALDAIVQSCVSVYKPMETLEALIPLRHNPVFNGRVGGQQLSGPKIDATHLLGYTWAILKRGRPIC